jgi:hypothetical protein
MNNDILNAICAHIIAELFSIYNKDKTSDELIQIIKPILIKLGEDERLIGRTEVLNYLESEIEILKQNKYI